MPLRAIAAKAFVPARDHALSRAFYRDLGFTEDWATDGLAHFHRDGASFLLQDFHVAEHTANFQMSLLVDDVDGWWASIRYVGRWSGRSEDRCPSACACTTCAARWSRPFAKGPRRPAGTGPCGTGGTGAGGPSPRRR